MSIWAGKILIQDTVRSSSFFSLLAWQKQTLTQAVMESYQFLKIRLQISDNSYNRVV